MDQKLNNLHQTADEMLSGMQAAPMGAQQILRKEQGERKHRISGWVRVGAPVFAALVLFSGILLWRSTGDFRTPTSTPAVETIAAGESSGEKNYPARADLPVGSVTLSGVIPERAPEKGRAFSPRDIRPCMLIFPGFFPSAEAQQAETDGLFLIHRSRKQLARTGRKTYNESRKESTKKEEACRNLS